MWVVKRYLGAGRVRREVRQVLVDAENVFRCWEGEEGGQAGAGEY